MDIMARQGVIDERNSDATGSETAEVSRTSDELVSSSASEETARVTFLSVTQRNEPVEGTHSILGLSTSKLLVDL